MSNQQRLTNLQNFFTKNPKGKMNGLQIIDHYRAFHPCIDVPLNIDFVAMYRSIYYIAMNSEVLNVRYGFSK